MTDISRQQRGHRNEVASDPKNFPYNPDPSRPETELQALMETMPFGIPRESLEEIQPLREAVADCMAKLNKKDRMIIDAINSEGLSLQDLADRLGCSKPHAMRQRDAVYAKMKKRLLAHPFFSENIDLDDD